MEQGQRKMTDEDSSGQDSVVILSALDNGRGDGAQVS